MREPARSTLIPAQLKIRLVASVLIILLTFGCASLQGKFNTSTAANVGVFADNTIAMLSETNLGFSTGKALYTREFYALDENEEQRLIENKEKAEKVLAIMVKYSLKLVTIAETEPDEVSRVKAYAEFLTSIDDSAVEALGLEKDHYNQLIEKVSSQKNFLDALKVAQPIINSIGRFLEIALSDMAESIDALAKKVDKKIDQEYADLIRYQETLEAERYSILSGLELLYLSTKGDTEAYERFLNSGVIVDPELLPKEKPSYKDIRKISEYLVGRMDGLHRIVEEIAPDWELYRKTHLELDRLADNGHSEIRQIRIINLVWLRAHQKMASGVTSPAEWFDISDAPSQLIQMGVKTVF